jgi:hypothetical protein
VRGRESGGVREQLGWDVCGAAAADGEGASEGASGDTRGRGARGACSKAAMERGARGRGAAVAGRGGAGRGQGPSDQHRRPSPHPVAGLPWPSLVKPQNTHLPAACPALQRRRHHQLAAAAPPFSLHLRSHVVGKIVGQQVVVGVGDGVDQGVEVWGADTRKGRNKKGGGDVLGDVFHAHGSTQGRTSAQQAACSLLPGSTACRPGSRHGNRARSTQPGRQGRQRRAASAAAGGGAAGAHSLPSQTGRCGSC